MRLNVPAMAYEHKAQRAGGGTGGGPGRLPPSAGPVARPISLAVPEGLCLLSVHAHPDDEASKGAPTVAKIPRRGGPHRAGLLHRG